MEEKGAIIIEYQTASVYYNFKWLYWAFRHFFYKDLAIKILDVHFDKNPHEIEIWDLVESRHNKLNYYDKIMIDKKYIYDNTNLTYLILSRDINSTYNINHIKHLMSNNRIVRHLYRAVDFDMMSTKQLMSFSQNEVRDIVSSSYYRTHKESKKGDESIKDFYLRICNT